MPNDCRPTDADFLWTGALIVRYKRVMRGSAKFRFSCLMLVLLCGTAFAADDFSWSFRSQEVIGREDTSVGNTSRLSESDRTDLINLLIVRLDKPMAERGYDNDRIHEIATTTRIRFVDLGNKGKPVIMATEVSVEGGCEKNNCPFWIFRKTADGWVSLLDTYAASYTVQPDKTNGYSDLVMTRHDSNSQSTLTLFRYQDGKYVDSGCYLAIWPPAKDGEVQDPEISSCKAEQTGETPAAIEAAPASDEKPAAEPEATEPPQKPSASEVAPADNGDKAAPAEPADKAAPAEPEAKPATPSSEDKPTPSESAPPPQ